MLKKVNHLCNIQLTLLPFLMSASHGQELCLWFANNMRHILQMYTLNKIKILNNSSITDIALTLNLYKTGLLIVEQITKFQVHLLEVENRLNSCKLSYSGHNIVSSSLYQHAPKPPPNFQVHTFQLPAHVNHAPKIWIHLDQLYVKIKSNYIEFTSMRKSDTRRQYPQISPPASLVYRYSSHILFMIHYLQQ